MSMKNLLIIGVFLISSVYASAQDYALNSAKVLNGASIVWEQNTMNLGTVEKGTTTTVKFEFTNNGNQSLVIERVKTSCGCTATEYPKKPILPGQAASILVSYNAKSIGSFHKTVLVYSNAIESTTSLRIKGTVN